MNVDKKDPQQLISQPKSFDNQVSKMTTLQVASNLKEISIYENNPIPLKKHHDWTILTGFVKASIVTFPLYFTFRFWSPHLNTSLNKQHLTMTQSMKLAVSHSIKDMRQFVRSPLGLIKVFLSESTLLAMDCIAEKKAVEQFRAGNMIMGGLTPLLTLCTVPIEVHNMAKPAFSAPAKAYLCVAGRQLSTIYTLAIGELISSKNNDHKTKAMLAASAYPINILGTIFQNKFCQMIQGENKILANRAFAITARNFLYISLTGAFRMTAGLTVGICLASKT